MFLKLTLWGDSLQSPLNVRDHVSQPYSTTGNIIVLYILIFKFSERSLDNTEVKIHYRTATWSSTYFG